MVDHILVVANHLVATEQMVDPLLQLVGPNCLVHLLDSAPPAAVGSDAQLLAQQRLRAHIRAYKRRFAYVTGELSLRPVAPAIQSAIAAIRPDLIVLPVVDGHLSEGALLATLSGYQNLLCLQVPAPEQGQVLLELSPDPNHLSGLREMIGFVSGRFQQAELLFVCDQTEIPGLWPAIAHKGRPAIEIDTAYLLIEQVAASLRSVGVQTVAQSIKFGARQDLVLASASASRPSFVLIHRNPFRTAPSEEVAMVHALVNQGRSVVVLGP